LVRSRGARRKTPVRPFHEARGREGEDELQRHAELTRGGAMKRRLFLKASASAALATPALVHTGFAADSIGTDRFFYDARFADARALAARFGATAAPVNGDVTAIWTGGLNRVSQTRALSLSGVTTESFYFCLHTLLQSHATVTMRSERITADLHRWSIRSTPKTG
jgi:hypothetical protein